MNTPTVLITLLSSFLTIAACLAFMLKLELTATQTELKAATTRLTFEAAENTRLRDQHARKVDRALWMLVAVRTDRIVTKAPQIIREPLDLNLRLDANLVDALERQSVVGGVALHSLLSEHLARRLVKTATTTEKQQVNAIHAHEPAKRTKSATI